MSSKKIVITKDFSIRLNEVVKYLSLNKRRQGKVAKMIGVSPSYFSEVLNLKTGPSFKLLFGIAKKFPGISLNWLLTGEGEMLQRLKKESEIQIAEETPIIYKVENSKDDPETIKLLSMTREVLKSNTDYSVSLAASIRSFHRAIKTENRLNKMEDEISEIKDKFKQADRIRNNDPELEKGTILKKRVM